MATKTTRKAKIVAKDNGYFEVWERPDGSQVRVSTEYKQWAFKHHKGERTRFHAATRERLSS